MSLLFVYIFFLTCCAGLTIGEFWAGPIGVWWGLLAGGLVLCSFRRGRWLGLSAIGIGLGCVLMVQARTLTATDIAHHIGQDRVLEGNVVQPASVLGISQRLVLADIHVGDQPQNGSVLVSTTAFLPIAAGSRVQVGCALQTLTESSRWRQWSRGIHARCSSPDVRVVQVNVRSWRAMLGRWQERMLHYVRRQYNEPQAALLNGILMGNTDGMPDNLTTAFQSTGTTHIVALSGFNITILIASMMTLTVRLVGRRFAWLPSIFLVISFVVMCGAAASVVRAATMAVVAQLGLWFGRPIAISRVMIYTALIMLFANPLLLWHDLGFQLSFLATIGLVAVAKPLQHYLSFIPEALGLRENLSTTLGAIIMTEPLLLWRFGRLSLVAPLVNLLVVPLVPFAMAFGGASLLGLGWAPLATITVPLADATLRLILALISLGANLPMAQVFPPLMVMILIGVLLMGLTSILLYHYDRETPTP